MGRILTIIFVLLLLLVAVGNAQKLSPMPSVVDVDHVKVGADVCVDILLVNPGTRTITVIGAQAGSSGNVRLTPGTVNVPASGSASVRMCLRLATPGYHDITIDLMDAVGTVCAVRLTVIAEEPDVTGVRDQQGAAPYRVVRTESGWTLHHPTDAPHRVAVEAYTYDGRLHERIAVPITPGTQHTPLPFQTRIDVRHLIVVRWDEATPQP